MKTNTPKRCDWCARYFLKTKRYRESRFCCSNCRRLYSINKDKIFAYFKKETHNQTL